MARRAGTCIMGVDKDNQHTRNGKMSHYKHLTFPSFLLMLFYYSVSLSAKKKEEMNAKKNALRAEDISKGVFVPVSSLQKNEPQKAERTA